MTESLLTEPAKSSTLDVVTTAVTSILIAFCIIGNSLVCAVVRKNHDMRVPINYLLVNMAVSDVLYSTFHLSELIFKHIPTKPESMSRVGFCFARNPPLQWAAAIASIWSLVVIAIERYFVVTDIHGNGKLSMEKLKVIIPCIWIFSLVLQLPPFLSLNYDLDTNVCLPLEPWIYLVWIMTHFAFILTSSVLMAGLYSRVVYALWFKQDHGNALPPEQQVVLKVRKRVTLMVLTVTAIFAICWNSDLSLHFLEIFYFKGRPLPLGRAIIHTMLMFNAAVNPFAYALINRRFRKKLYELLPPGLRLFSVRVFPL
ncbi:PREDICTED: pyroglutamylated RFamide peptide receptor-like isoform X2 [Acropora digitifera]|nr:PREDICTED: pyroglutamylated RFamide peptide receptor-like isoform X2 [Acropora digitifera]